MLWECSSYSTCRDNFQEALKQLLGARYADSAGDRGPVAGVGGRVGKSGKSGISHGKGEGHVVYASVNCVCNVCGSAHSCGCVVNGTFARAAF